MRKYYLKRLFANPCSDNSHLLKFCIRISKLKKLNFPQYQFCSIKNKFETHTLNNGLKGVHSKEEKLKKIDWNKIGELVENMKPAELNSFLKTEIGNSSQSKNSSILSFDIRNIQIILKNTIKAILKNKKLDNKPIFIESIMKSTIDILKPISKEIDCFGFYLKSMDSYKFDNFFSKGNLTKTIEEKKHLRFLFKGTFKQKYFQFLNSHTNSIDGIHSNITGNPIFLTKYFQDFNSNIFKYLNSKEIEGIDNELGFESEFWNKLNSYQKNSFFIIILKSLKYSQINLFLQKNNKNEFLNECFQTKNIKSFIINCRILTMMHQISSSKVYQNLIIEKLTESLKYFPKLLGLNDRVIISVVLKDFFLEEKSKLILIPLILQIDQVFDEYFSVIFISMIRQCSLSKSEIDKLIINFNQRKTRIPFIECIRISVELYKVGYRDINFWNEFLEELSTIESNEFQKFKNEDLLNLSIAINNLYIEIPNFKNQNDYWQSSEIAVCLDSISHYSNKNE